MKKLLLAMLVAVFAVASLKAFGDPKFLCKNYCVSTGRGDVVTMDAGKKQTVFYYNFDGSYPDSAVCTCGELAKRLNIQGAEIK
jgi:hypothetical protein